MWNTSPTDCPKIYVAVKCLRAEFRSTAGRDFFENEKSTTIDLVLGEELFFHHLNISSHRKKYEHHEKDANGNNIPATRQRFDCIQMDIHVPHIWKLINGGRVKHPKTRLEVDLTVFNSMHQLTQMSTHPVADFLCHFEERRKSLIEIVENLVYEQQRSARETTTNINMDTLTQKETELLTKVFLIKPAVVHVAVDIALKSGMGFTDQYIATNVFFCEWLLSWKFWKNDYVSMFWKKVPNKIRRFHDLSYKEQFGVYVELSVLSSMFYQKILCSTSTVQDLTLGVCLFELHVGDGQKIVEPYFNNDTLLRVDMHAPYFRQLVRNTYPEYVTKHTRDADFSNTITPVQRFCTPSIYVPPPKKKSYFADVQYVKKQRC